MTTPVHHRQVDLIKALMELYAKEDSTITFIRLPGWDDTQGVDVPMEDMLGMLAGYVEYLERGDA